MVPIDKETRAHANEPVLVCLVSNIISPDADLLYMNSKENELGSQNWWCKWKYLKRLHWFQARRNVSLRHLMWAALGDRAQSSHLFSEGTVNKNQEESLAPHLVGPETVPTEESENLTDTAIYLLVQHLLTWFLALPVTLDAFSFLPYF